MARAQRKARTGGGARRGTRGLIGWAVLALLAALVAAALYYRPVISGYATTGTSYGARVACSCRYVGGRSLDDCKKDFESGMELVSLADDPDSRTVTATFPLLGSQRATYREGWGCQLEEWNG